MCSSDLFVLLPPPQKSASLVKVEHYYHVEGDCVILHAFNEDHTDRIYYIVPWDNRTYLLQKEEFLAFVDAIRTGQEPSKMDQFEKHPFFVRYHPKEALPKGLPRFPEQFRPLLKGVTLPKRHAETGS